MEQDTTANFPVAVCDSATLESQPIVEDLLEPLAESENGTVLLVGEPDTNVNGRVTVLLIAIASMILVFTGGISFGYPAIKPSLIDSGVYGWLCDKNISVAQTLSRNNITSLNTTHCPDQMLRINLIYQIMAGGCGFLSIPSGIIQDLLGRKILSFVSCIGWTLSLIGFGVSSQHFDLFIPSFALMGIAGIAQWLVFLTYTQDLPKYKGFINGIIVAMFDLSTIIFFVFNLIYFATGFSPLYMFLVWSVFGIAWFVFSFFIDSGLKSGAPPRKKVTLDTLKNILPWKTLFSVEVLLGTTMFNFQVLGNNFMMSTVLNQAENISGNYETALIMNTVFSIMLPLVGVTSSIILGWVTDKIGLLKGYILLLCISIGWTICGLLPFVWPQLITYTLFLTWRLYIYLLISDWIFSGFDRDITSRLYTFFLTYSGLVILIFPYLMNWIVVRYLKDSYFWPNVAIGVMNNGTTLVFILYLKFRRVEPSKL